MSKHQTLMVGVLIGGVTGTFSGWIVVPLLTQGWLFKGSMPDIQRFSGPTLLVFASGLASF